MKSSIPKAFMPVHGKPILLYTLERILQLTYVRRVIIAVSEDMMAEAGRMITSFENGLNESKKNHEILLVTGGRERLYSINNALQETGGEDLIAVHDAVRPMIDPADFTKVCDKAMQDGAALLMTPSSNTLKKVDLRKGSRIKQTIDRTEVWQILTPQVFRAGILRDAYAKAMQDNRFGTDDATLVEQAGYPVYGVEGAPDNIKITYKEDLHRFMSYLSSSQIPRIGYGYDSHRLKTGRKLILGGVNIPHEKGLDGHSDADVLTHAVIDAILGALALGDIGSHFPDTDDTFRNADSRALLKKVFQKITEQGYSVGNIDATIVAQKPKLRNYIDHMRANIAEDCRCELHQISVKATTAERMGALGREEGISCSAVALLVNSPA